MQQACSCLYLYLCLTISACLIASARADPAEALLQLKQGFGNPSALSSWNRSINASPCSGWAGVTCAAGTVIGLRLSRIDLATFSISSSIGDLPGLRFLVLSGNRLSGSIPPEIGKLRSLQVLDLSNNFLTGGLRLLAWSNLTELANLTLTQNVLNGSIPTELAAATGLVRIRLENNSLSGVIPPSIFDGSLPKLRSFAVEFNNISGFIPAQIGESLELRSFYAAHNWLAGVIPESIGGLTHLTHFEVNDNFLTGPLPESVVNLTGSLITFNVSYNNLSGQIPAAFSAKFNDSSDFVGNPSLCGLPLSNDCVGSSATAPSALTMAPPFVNRSDPMNQEGNYESHRGSSTHRTLIIVIAVIGGILCALLLLLMLLLFSRKYKQRKGSNVSSADNWFSADLQADRRKGSYEVFTKSFQYSYEEIVANAGYFDTAHVIGKGRFAFVYRCHLPDGTQIAVKVFRFSNVAPGFQREIELLASIRHRNLLTIKGLYANPVEKAIFYDYMPAGTLYELLHGRQGEVQENSLPGWPVRHRIALGVAQAMAFLHRGCGYRILHRDLKSTNILLDKDLNARVSDHGLVHLVSGQTGDVIETPIYTAPEVLTSKKHSEKGDVYSYGVVLLELMTGKKPVSYANERAVSLTDWVLRLHEQGRGRLAIDELVLETCPRPEYLDKCLHLAILCVNGNPDGRPTAAEIVSIVEGCCPAPSPLRSPDFRSDVPLLP